MRIEVAVVTSESSNKAKGDLLENLTAELLRIQNYFVEQQIRVTASELDLFCRYKVNNRSLYVECKAHREALSAKELTNILGTVDLKGYDEGWLVSTGTLGKDAKGFQQEWEDKPPHERQRLSIYTPERVIESLKDARLIMPPPNSETEIDKTAIRFGEWLLLLTQAGRFWAAPTLEFGLPQGVAVYDASNGQLVTQN